MQFCIANYQKSNLKICTFNKTQLLKGFKAISFENINKKVNIGPEQKDGKGRGTNFSNFLLEQYFI